MPQLLAFTAALLAAIILGTPLASAKDTWIQGQLDDIRIYSNASESRTLRIVQELRDVRATLSMRMPRLVARQTQPIRVFVCKNASTMRQFSKLYNDKPVDAAGYFLRDREGPMILIDSDREIGQTRTTIYHEYIHYLTSSRSYRLPPWLSEGMAEAYSTIEFKKGTASVGRADSHNVQTLREARPIPLERFFRIMRSSPEYNVSGHGRSVFYAQSWAFVHYCLFAKNDLPKDAFTKLILSAISQPWIEEDEFKAITNLTFDQMERKLSRYVATGRYTIYNYKLPQEEEKLALEFRKLTEGEIDLIFGTVLLATRGPDHSIDYFLKAEGKLADSSEAAAGKGFLEMRRERWDAAAEALQKAVDRDSSSAAVYLYHANCVMRDANPNGSLAPHRYDKQLTHALLTSLFKARDLGNSSPELYRLIGRAWLGSNMTPTDGHLEALREGLKLYPEDDRIGYYLALLYQRTDQTEKAKELADFFLQTDLDAKGRKVFTTFSNRLPVAEEAAN